MRDIKFKNIGANRFYDISVPHPDASGKVLSQNIYSRFEENQPQVETLTIESAVAQFTGLKDKNGVEIFEGDKFKAFESVVEVVFERGAFGYRIDFRFVSFAENFANLKGKGNVLAAVEVVK